MINVHEDQKLIKSLKSQVEDGRSLSVYDKREGGWLAKHYDICDCLCMCKEAHDFLADGGLGLEGRISLVWQCWNKE